MHAGELLSLLINIGVGIYFIHYYPRSVRGKLQQMPRIFSVLNRVLPILGYLLIGATLLYAVLRASSVV